MAGVEPRSDGVTVVTESGGRLEAAFAIGADGARSSVRTSLEIPLEGPRTENAFVIVDTAEDPDAPLPVERIFHYEHPAVDGRNVLFVPFAGHWRVDLQCRPDDDADAFSGRDGVASWLPLVIDPKYVDRVTWVSTYVFLQVLARQFADESGRVLLVGEAAHLFAPFGARGLNSGIPDAIVAARAIRAALDGSSGAVAHFAESRRAAAERNRAASNEALAHLAPASEAAKARRREAALRGAARLRRRPLARRCAVRAAPRPARRGRHAVLGRQLPGERVAVDLALEDLPGRARRQRVDEDDVARVLVRGDALLHPGLHLRRVAAATPGRGRTSADDLLADPRVAGRRRRPPRARPGARRAPPRPRAGRRCSRCG